MVLKLLQCEIYFVGTRRSNQLAGCQLEDEKDLVKRGRGSFDVRVDREESTATVKWYDNKSVTLISSYCATEPQDKVQRWSKSGKAFMEVNRPHIVKEYNIFMEGINLLNVCVARYKYHMRSQRWYLYLFWQTIMLGLVNACSTWEEEGLDRSTTVKKEPGKVEESRPRGGVEATRRCG
ncbi:hypothetical protein AOLI_G00248100 [Acnodon oligacanthus]